MKIKHTKYFYHKINREGEIFFCPRAVTTVYKASYKLKSIDSMREYSYIAIPCRPNSLFIDHELWQIK